MNFRHKRRQRTKRILDICANGEPIAYIAFNEQRSKSEGQFIWRTTKAFRKYRKDEEIHKKYSHYMRSLQKCTAHCMEWLIFNTSPDAKNLKIEEPKNKPEKKKAIPPEVDKKLKEAESLLARIEAALEEEKEKLQQVPKAC